MTTRRGALGGMTASLAALAIPSLASSRTATLAPRLRLGDTVALVAPASAVSERQLFNAEFTVSGMGLVPKFGAHVGGRFGYLAGTDDQRASDLNAAFEDETVRAIFAIRGGYGAARILPLIDWQAVRRNPKLLIGYSDTTALHLAVAREGGFPTLHAPNAASRWEKDSWESLWRLAFTGETPSLKLDASRVLIAGIGEGRLLGGNLTILSTLMGSGRLPDMTGAILFLEDINEEPYRVDRMLQQLKLTGILDAAAGIIVGNCTRCDAQGANPETFAVDDVYDQLLGSLRCPVVTGANIGHISNQLALPHGARVRFDTAADTLSLLAPMVE